MPTHSLFHTPFPFYPFSLLFTPPHFSPPFFFSSHLFFPPPFFFSSLHTCHTGLLPGLRGSLRGSPPHRKHLSSATEPPLSPASGHSSGRATLPGALHRSRSPSIHRTTWSHATALRPIFQSHCSSVSLSSLHTLDSQE